MWIQVDFAPGPCTLHSLSFEMLFKTRELIDTMSAHDREYEYVTIAYRTDPKNGG